MIEFKGECGHIIRAREDDVGKVVRCTYCGREALVQEPVAQGEDLIFDQVEKTGVYDAHATRASRKSAKRRERNALRDAAGKPPIQDLDPFAVAMKMIYVAVIIIVLAVTWKFSVKFYHSVRPEANPRSPVTASKPGGLAEGTPVKREKPRVGLTAVRLNPQQCGAYVASVPQGATVYHLPGFGMQDKLFTDIIADKHLVTNNSLRLAPGKHTVAMAMRINDPALMRLEGYGELRRKIESNEYDEARLMAGYFVPDGSVALELVRIHDIPHIVRVYEVEVEARQWIAVTAMFLPRMPLSDLMDDLPEVAAFVFDTDEVRGELDYYEVPTEDRVFILSALGRIGKVCYQRDDQTPYRLFQIGPSDGMLRTETLGF